MSGIKTLFSDPGHMLWWQWGQVLGAVLPALLGVLGIDHPLAWAIALHFLIDFTCQSGCTACNKAKGDLRTLVYHSFISGGYAGFAAGGLEGLAVSVVIHFIVDLTNKFGLGEPAGPIADQVSHIATILLIWWLLA
jgi:hypothetical protein